jgi:hypothetical protein
MPDPASGHRAPDQHGVRQVGKLDASAEAPWTSTTVGLVDESDMNGSSPVRSERLPFPSIGPAAATTNNHVSASVVAIGIQLRSRHPDILALF